MKSRIEESRELARTSFGRVRVEVEGHPAGDEDVVSGARVQLLVGADRLVQLLLANVTPGAHRIADSDNLKRCHCASYDIYSKASCIQE
jgi:hypothetical protein